MTSLASDIDGYCDGYCWGITIFSEGQYLSSLSRRDTMVLRWGRSYKLWDCYPFLEFYVNVLWQAPYWYSKELSIHNFIAGVSGMQPLFVCDAWLCMRVLLKKTQLQDVFNLGKFKCVWTYANSHSLWRLQDDDFRTAAMIVCFSLQRLIYSSLSPLQSRPDMSTLYFSVVRV